MSNVTKAFGLMDPDGELSAFAGYSQEAAWVVLGHLLGRDVKADLEAGGWRVVPVEIRVSQPQEEKVK